MPCWAFCLSALGLWAYQTLDALDGKQALRTNTSTALDELFDHGCDAVSTGRCTCKPVVLVPLIHLITMIIVLACMYASWCLVVLLGYGILIEKGNKQKKLNKKTNKPTKNNQN